MEVGAALPAIKVINHGIRDFLNHSLSPIDIYGESFDTTFFSHSDMQREVRGQILNKSRTRRPSLLFATGVTHKLNLWGAYSQYATVAIVLFLLEAAIIAGLLWQRKKRIAAQAKLVHANALLHRSMHDHREAQRVGQIGSWTRDLRTGAVTWSLEMYRIVGRDPNLPPPSFAELAPSFTPDSWKRFEAAQAEASRVGNVTSIDLELVCPDGSRRWISDRGEVERDSSGDIVRISGITQDITDRKRTEAALRELEEANRATFDEAAVGIAHISLDGRWLRVNDKICAIAGYSRDEMMRLKFQDITPPEDLEEDLEGRLQLLSGELKKHFMEKRYVRKDGSLVWVDVAVSLVRNSSGEPDYFITVLTDITERKRMEAELRWSESELKQAQRIAGLGSWQWDPKTEVMTWSDELIRMVGWNPAEPIPSFQEHGRFFEPESWRRLTECVEKALRTRQPYEVDLEGTFPDGRKAWVTNRGEVVCSAAGDIISVRGTVQDITERKTAELVLRETEERFRTIANSAPVLIWMSGPDNGFTYCNDPWLTFTGRPLDQHLGLGWIKSLHPDDQQKCLQQCVENAARQRPFKNDYRLRRHDGVYRWMIDTGVPRFNADGSFAGYIGSCVDDTDRRAGEETLRTVSRRLIQAQEKERKRIARELHDDISQRLAILAVGLQRLQNESRLSAAQMRDRIEKLFNDTTDISSEIQAMSHQLHSSSLDYLGLIPAIRGFCDDLSRNHELVIDVEHAGVTSPLPPDVALGLFRVTQEALHNAVKYSGVKKVEIQLRGTAEDIQLTVRDSGAGFSIEAAMHGHGLGLISMKERILALNGTISIVSKPQHGTEITARVPLVSVH